MHTCKGLHIVCNGRVLSIIVIEEATFHEITKYTKVKLRNKTIDWTGKVRNAVKLNVLRDEKIMSCLVAL